MQDRQLTFGALLLQKQSQVPPQIASGAESVRSHLEYADPVDYSIYVHINMES